MAYMVVLKSVFPLEVATQTAPAAASGMTPGAAPEAEGPAVGTALPPATLDSQAPYKLLLANVLPSGAIKVKPDDDRIIPYFANLAAMALLPDRPLDVRDYLQWYLAHLNRPDRFGLYATIYDFAVDDNGFEQPTQGYDSADSYAATFLTLLRAYVETTGDRDFVRANLVDIERVASVILQLQDSDGLVWATAARREKYLMDNCEDYRGLDDFAAVMDDLGVSDAAAVVREAARRIADGIETRFWDPARGNYDWAIYTFRVLGRKVAEFPRKSSWRQWYPGTVAQVFPVVTGVLRPSDPRAVSLYASLNARHPGWVNQAKRDPNPWSVLGYAAALMGDDQRAMAFVRATSAVYLDRTGPYSGLSWELAWHLLTLRLVLNPTASVSPTG